MPPTLEDFYRRISYRRNKNIYNIELCDQEKASVIDFPGYAEKTIEFIKELLPAVISVARYNETPVCFIDMEKWTYLYRLIGFKIVSTRVGYVWVHALPNPNYLIPILVSKNFIQYHIDRVNVRVQYTKKYYRVKYDPKITPDILLKIMNHYKDYKVIYRIPTLKNNISFILSNLNKSIGVGYFQYERPIMDKTVYRYLSGVFLDTFSKLFIRR